MPFPPRPAEPIALLHNCGALRAWRVRYNLRMERREFVKLCAASAAATGFPEFAAADAAPTRYARVKLLDEQGKPMRAAAVPAQRNLIFHYPYAATPCFLLNLGKPSKAAVSLKTSDNRDYRWGGGVGPQRSIVAYSAICAHQLAYPTKEISFISYRAEASARNKHAQVIHCCAEHSQYDPSDGARVVAGPAPQPLAAILLEHDAKSDELFAVGTLGGEMFRQFFAKYEMKLSLETGGGFQNAVQGTTVVSDMQNYCRQQVKC
jgi:arsenite oxidase small subunit